MKQKKFKRCRNCNSRIIEYPIYKGQEQEISLLPQTDNLGIKLKALFSGSTMRRINWYNLLIGDWTKFIVIVGILFVAWAYSHDIESCKVFLEDKCEYVKQNQFICAEIERLGERPNIPIIENIKTT